MEIDVNTLIQHYSDELVKMTQRAIMAEVRAESAETKLESIEREKVVPERG